VVVCDLPVSLLTDEAPRYDRPQATDPSLRARLAFEPGSIAEPASWRDELLTMLRSPNLGSRDWVWRQYDQIVRGGTRLRAGSDAAVVRVPCEIDDRRIDKFLAFAVDCNGRICELDAYEGGAMAVAEACRNLVCTGAAPIGLTDCLNFGSPERPHVMRQFARAIDGIAAACHALEVPIVSGNVSFYNETDGRAILPTPTIAAVGQLESVDQVRAMFFPLPSLAVVMLGAASGGPLGGSEYVCRHTGEVKGPPPRLDLALEARLQGLVLALIRDGLVASAHDVSEGGLAVALAECCATIGATIDLSDHEPLPAALFGEAPSRVIVTVDRDAAATLERRAIDAGVPAKVLGKTGGHALVIKHEGRAIIDVAVSTLNEARLHCLDAIVGG
jgi:phosphoribosylformylglycinamidine synthase